MKTGKFLFLEVPMLELKFLVPIIKKHKKLI